MAVSRKIEKCADLFTHKQATDHWVLLTGEYYILVDNRDGGGGGNTGFRQGIGTSKETGQEEKTRSKDMRHDNEKDKTQRQGQR